MQSGLTEVPELTEFEIACAARTLRRCRRRGTRHQTDLQIQYENIDTMSTPQLAKIRSILKEHGRLSRDAEALAAETDLYQAGMTSHASVNVMLALEGEFEVEFPDHMLKRNVFNTIASISAALDELTV
jgi:acyl carrier protein